VQYLITLECTGVPAEVGEEAAFDIAQEFRIHRPWHQNVLCTYEGDGILRLVAQNDFDDDGEALSDEFSDCMTACIEEAFEAQIRTVSVLQIPAT
jgi:hypothetical protein